jgi:Mg-chelatase subunit ChlD
MIPVPKKSSDKLELLVETEALNEKNGILHVSVVPPEKGIRKPSTFICAIDTSGSMSNNATLTQKEEGEDLFSRLDLVKYSVKTVIHMMEPEDNICLIPFEYRATIALPLQSMNKTGKDKALDIIDGLDSSGSTNIWDSLKLSIEEVLKNEICKTTNNYILLFTGGEPTDNPPKGIVPTLKDKIAETKNSYEEFSIHTFGYGYSLDSKLLCDIAEVSNGAFNYIPDSTMIGTIFVNFLSNTLSSSVANAKLTIAPSSGLVFKSIGYEMVDNSVITGII